MSADEKQWRRLAIEALSFIGQIAKEIPAAKTRCEAFAANAIGEHCGPLIEDQTTKTP